jgi:phenylpyruvate tautomerase
MPLLKIQTNLATDAQTRQTLIREASTLVAEMLNKPERYVMVSFECNPDMLFGGDDTALAYLELKSIGLPAERTGEFSATLCELMTRSLRISPQRVYIEFSDATRQLWGWNSATF